MSPAQLEKYRRASVLYCKIMDLDPDEEVQHITPQGSTAKAPRWHLVAAKIREEFAMRLALNTQTL